MGKPAIDLSSVATVGLDLAKHVFFRGLVRWLCPEFQAPDYQAPVSQQLDLGKTAVVVHDNVIPWPATLPEQGAATVGPVLVARRRGDGRYAA